MSLNLAAVRIIVYDLDGTVYDDTRHFDLYAREIQSYLPEDAREPFFHDYLAVVEGRHAALQVGSFYDTKRDLVLKPKAGRIRTALRWDGHELPAAEVEQLYPGIVEPDIVNIMNVGDLWWVPTAISRHYGGQPEKHQKAFFWIRETMSDPNFAMRAISELDKLIGDLRGRVVQVLATNSPQPDSEAILRKVGLLGLFDRYSYGTGKPMGLKPLFEELCAEYGVEMSAILSVGDNLVNEITPAQALGCQTVFIDPHSLGEDDDADLRTGSMLDLIPILRDGLLGGRE